MKEALKKIGALFALFFAFIGLVGGVGCLCDYAKKAGEWSDVIVPIIGLLVLVALAWPKAVELWKILNSTGK